MTCEYVGVLKWLYDWQTLIAGMLALGAACVAARPVWRQLRLSARDPLVGRVAALESRREITRQLATSITSKFARELHPYGDDGEIDPNPHWAFEAEHEVDDAVETLTVQQENSLDGELVDAKRNALIKAGKQLSGCLYYIHAANSVDFGGFEEPSEEERPAFQQREEQAKRELEGHISLVGKCASDLDMAFVSRIKDIHGHIRRIDRLAENARTSHLPESTAP